MDRASIEPAKNNEEPSRVYDDGGSGSKIDGHLV
jgi:hypothetical protein